MAKNRMVLGAFFSAVLFFIISVTAFASAEVLSGDVPREEVPAQAPYSGEYSNETAYITKGHMTSGVKDGKPLDRVLSFFPESPHFYAIARLRSAPPGTKVRFSWAFVPENQHIDDGVISVDQEAHDLFVYSNLTNNTGKPWPKGIFRVKIFIGDRREPEQVIYFEVE